MTIEQPNKIDGLGLGRSVKEVVLMISDHLSWQDGQTHFTALEKKIGNYLNFVKSGQILESFPHASGLPVRINLIYKYEPDAPAENILQTVKRQLSEMGITFTYEALPEKY